MSNFTPRQRTPLSVQILDQVQGDVSTQIANHTLTLIPPIAAGSILHDNACGSGNVTEVVLSTQKKPSAASSIHIHATDISPPRIQVVCAKVAQHGWQDIVEAAVVPAQALSFSDETFTHSFTNFALFAVPEALQAAAHVYRTLKTGGVAVVTTWATMPHNAAISAAHEATRASDSVLAMRIPERWYAAETLENVLQQAGFRAIKMSQKEAYLTIENVPLWVSYVWSVLGQPTGGWGVSDEECWEKAIKVLEERLGQLEEFERVGNEGGKIRMIANIAVASK